jgi:hypothetical protein
MAKKGLGGGNIGLVLALVIIGIVITLISNIFNFPIIVTHGPKQYISNIWQGHHDFYGLAKSNYKVYEKILPVSELVNETPKATIKKGYAFKFKGYIQKGSLTWIAVKVFNSSTAINGYFVIEEKSGDSTFWTSVPFNSGDNINNKYFREISDKEFEKVREFYKSKFVEKVYEKVEVREISGNLKVQKIEESETYKIIPYISTEEKAYYCTIKDFEIVEDLENRLLGKNFETNLLQTNSAYNPYYSDVYKESILVKFTSKWYFKVGFPIFLLIFLKSILGSTFTVTPKCPECRSKEFSLVERLLIAESYEHEKMNGERDRRFKNNPLISTYNLYFKCKECSHTWESQETKLTYGDKTGNIKRKRKRKTTPPPIIHLKTKDKIQSIQSSNNDTLSTSDIISIHSSKSENVHTSDVVMTLMSQFEQGLIDEKVYRKKLALLIRKVNVADESKKGKENLSKRSVVNHKGNPKFIMINGNMTVDELKSSFKISSGINIRVYNGKRFADADSALYNLGYKYPKPLKLKLNDTMTVGNLEKAFREKVGISIQIENRKCKLADNSLSIFQI